jgi:CRISPR/Cas system-associated exonuclease Cas4 (RecB family)
MNQARPSLKPGASVERVFRNEFSWSLSRDRTFRECARKYYFAHYGMWGGWDPGADPRTREIYILKNLKTREMWAGAVVHEAVRRSLRLLRDARPVLAVEDILAITRAGMRAEWLASKRRLNRVDPKRRLGLVEHEYDLSVPLEEWRAVAARVERCLRRFYASSLFERLRSLAPDHWLATEELRQFVLPIGEEGIRVWVQLDLAFRDEEGNVVIVDWKTGNSRYGAEDHRTQLTCYALYATQAWRVRIDQVRLVEFHLQSGEATHHEPSQADVDAVRAFIQGSVLDMRGLLANPIDNLAIEEDFPRTRDSGRCVRCPFLRVCRPGWKDPHPPDDSRVAAAPLRAEVSVPVS